MKHLDVIVVGGGHAGVEAALAASRRGASTGLVSFNAQDFGVLSCNPAVGGIGKGHLVREIDALDGLMARAADYAGIQFRLLNASRGPAVHGPRTQVDRKRYGEFVRSEIERSAVEVLVGEVTDLVVRGDTVCGVTLASGQEIAARSVILTTGTFLGGTIHIGRERIPAGRRGAEAATRLAHRLREMAFSVGRLKTGTPARLDGKTIDWARVGQQPGDEVPTMLSFVNTTPVARQIACGVTATNERTHDIIRENLGLSAMRSGLIEGVGPRYCPSVEDKVTRFADKTSHNIFLEPEGLDDDTIYPNGISNSLPAAVQDAFLRTIVGLEEVRVLQYGYAIEYDFIDPRSLSGALAMKSLKGLFLAGQINGTTGYEEAGAQGLLAGANAAAHALALEPLSLSRGNSYTGVMVDDLLSRGVTEPYRMFTSRAEYRLMLRVDNADQRLTPIATAAGLCGDDRRRLFETKCERLSALREAVSRDVVPASKLPDVAPSLSTGVGSRPAPTVLAASDCDLPAFSRHLRESVAHEFADLQQVRNEAIYEPYLDRQQRAAAELARARSVRIMPDLSFAEIPSLSAELRQKLESRRPETIADAESIEGMTPAAIGAILARIKARQMAPAERGQPDAA